MVVTCVVRRLRTSRASARPDRAASRAGCFTAAYGAEHSSSILDVVSVSVLPPVGHDHRVGFYEDDPSLVAAVGGFLSEAIDRGGAIVIIAGESHRVALGAALAARGHAIDALTTSGRYRTLDAARILTQFMRSGRPDRDAFVAVVGRLVAEAARGGQRVSVYGEMVAELWDAGNKAAAIELESLWNDLATGRDFALFCGYAQSSVAARDDLVATKHLCDRHSEVLLLRDADAARAPLAADDTERVTRLFVPARASLSRVRLFVGDVLRLWGLERWADDASIVASELATNAIIHAKSPFRVAVSRAGAMIRISVQDTVAATPERLAPDPTTIGGRGIAIVDAIAGAWGADLDPDGKTVWAEMRAS